MAGDIHKRQSDRVFSQRQPNRPAALSLSFEIDRQLAPCGSIVTVLEPTSRNTDTQGHTSSIASKTLGKRAAATHNLTGKTRGFRHTNRTLRCVLPSIGNIKDHPQTEQLSRPEPGMRAGRYVHIGRHRPAIQNTSPDSPEQPTMVAAIVQGSGIAFPTRASRNSPQAAKHAMLSTRAPESTRRDTR